MKHRLLKREGNRELLVFFNGWGMDETPLGHLDAGALDLILLWDYTSPEIETDLEALARDYEKVHLAAWSFGVWSAARTLAGTKIPFASSLAINGTLRPIDDEFGIPLRVFDGTLEGWSEESRVKFYRRMCGREQFGFFMEREPKRSAGGQKAELAAFREWVLGEKQPENPFKTAALGAQDKIFSNGAQKKFWSGEKIEIFERGFGHYPFGTLKSWREVLELGFPG
ncbi:DUF452 family protein [bacterium]|nr:MAG: DUF452 family protein [bacterium]